MKAIIFTFLIVSILIKSSFQKHPRYSYVCQEDGNVEFTGFKAGSVVTIVNSQCGVTIVPDGRNTQVKNISAACMGQKLKDVRTVTVTVHDKNLNEDGKTPAPKGNIMGGLESHTLELQCNPISEISRTVQRQFHLVNVEHILSKENEISQVDMRFKAEDNITLPDISEVYIGDEFYMFLQYKGVTDYIIEPQSCTAYEGNDILASTDANKQEKLWDIAVKSTNTSGKCIAPNAQALGLVGSGGFKYLDVKTVRTRLNGFRFKNTMDDITISCRVLLKLVPSIGLTKDQPVCIGDTKRRRKRSSQSKDVTSLDIMQTLSVKDRANGGSSFASRTVVQFITVTASLFIIRIL